MMFLAAAQSSHTISAHPNQHTPVRTSGMHITAIATADMHENLLLAVTLVHGYPAPLNDITDTDCGSATHAEKHLTPCP